MATTRNIQMQYFNGTDYDTLYPKVNLSNVSGSISINKISGNLPATRVSYSNSSTSSIITGSNVQLAIDQLFQSVSNGKSQIASAITDKGVSTSSSASFSTMVSNIRKISTGSGYHIYGKGLLAVEGTINITVSGYYITEFIMPRNINSLLFCWGIKNPWMFYKFGTSNYIVTDRTDGSSGGNNPYTISGNKIVFTDGGLSAGDFSTLNTCIFICR